MAIPVFFSELDPLQTNFRINVKIIRKWKVDMISPGNKFEFGLADQHVIIFPYIFHFFNFLDITVCLLG